MSLTKRNEMMVDRALSWVDHHLDLFQAANSPEGLIHTALKPLVELSMLCLLLRRNAETPSDARIRRMLEASSRMWETHFGCDRLVRNPAAFRLYSMWHESLVQSGALPAENRHVIQAVVDHGYVTATEEVGFRDLDLRHLLDLGGYRHRLPSYRALYRQTVLGRGGPPLAFNQMDAYSVTHTLFYLTDFGARPIDAIPERQLPYVHWIVQTLLGQYLLLEDWDIVAELLLSAACLRWKPPDALYDAAWNGLLGAQRDDGAIPSRSFAEDSWTALPEPERRAYGFEHSYHTTLVGAMAGFIVPEQFLRSSYRQFRRRTLLPATRSEEWRLVAESADRWFASLLRMDLSLQQQLQVLIGLWLTAHRGDCEVDTQPSTPLAAAARRAADVLRPLASNPDGLAGIDAGLLLCGAWILRSLGTPDPGLESFASQLGQDLPPPGEPLDLDTAVQLASARHLLAALGYSPWIEPPAHGELATLCAGIGPDPFRLDEPTRARLTTGVLAASAFGHRALEGVDEAIRLAVPAWALTSLQRNQLERGALLLRVCNSICRAGDPSIAAGVAFLMTHQRTDGAFGFLGPECQKISEIRTDFRPELDVTLPVTVSVVWCLAEVLTSDVRLYPEPRIPRRAANSHRPKPAAESVPRMAGCRRRAFTPDDWTDHSPFKAISGSVRPARRAGR
jgi:Domain of unknown function (DUF6895)